MTEPEDTPAVPPADATPDDAQTQGRRPGERLAKAIARAGLGSRREAEAWIGEGRVVVNGETVASPNHNVEPGDRVEVDGRPLPERERTRLWLYHKPRGYVTTTHDPEGRETVFSILPESMPRVMTIGRLDINTEGLLLLTNDGGLARVLELPETGWLRRYRVRAFGRADPGAIEKLKDGVEIDGFSYGAIDAEIERQQKDNVWLRFGLREGKNREVKRVAEHLGLAVNRLIRISFGPFQLGDLPEGGVEEVRTRTLVDQLGKRLAEEAGCDFEAPAFVTGEDAPRKTGGRGGAGRPPAASPERRSVLDPSQRVGRRAPIARPRDVAAPASIGDAEAPETRTKRAAPVADRRGRQIKVERVTRADPDAAPKRVRKKDEGAAERFGAAGRPERPARPGAKGTAKPAGRGGADGFKPRTAGGGRFDRASGDRPAGDRPFGDRPRGDRPFGNRSAGNRPDRSRPDGDRPQREGFERPQRAEGGERPARPAAGAPRVSAPRWRDDGGAARERPYSPGSPRGDRPQGGRSFGDRPPRADGDRPRGPRPQGDRPSRDGDRPRGDRPQGGRSFGDRPPRADGDRPRGPRPQGDRPPRDGDRPQGRGFGDRPPRADGDRPRGPRPQGDRPPRGDRPQGDKPFRPQGDRPPRPQGDRPARGGDQGRGDRPGGGGRPQGKPGGRPTGGPRGPRPGGGAPRGGGKGPGSGGGKGRPGGADRRR